MSRPPARRPRAAPPGAPLRTRPEAGTPLDRAVVLLTRRPRFSAARVSQSVRTRLRGRHSWLARRFSAALRVVLHSCEVQDDARLVPDHPGIVPGRNHQDVARSGLLFQTINPPYVTPTRLHVFEVRHLATLGAGERPHALRPLPPRLEDPAAHRALRDVEDLRATFLEWTRLVRSLEPLYDHLRHTVSPPVFRDMASPIGWPPRLRPSPQVRRREEARADAPAAEAGAEIEDGVGGERLARSVRRHREIEVRRVRAERGQQDARVRDGPVDAHGREVERRARRRRRQVHRRFVDPGHEEEPTVEREREQGGSAGDGERRRVDEGAGAREARTGTLVDATSLAVTGAPALFALTFDGGLFLVPWIDKPTVNLPAPPAGAPLHLATVRVDGTVADTGILLTSLSAHPSYLDLAVASNGTGQSLAAYSVLDLGAGFGGRRVRARLLTTTDLWGGP